MGTGDEARTADGNQMKTNPATITEMDRAVHAGLAAARQVVDTTDLDEMLNELEQTWESVKTDFLALAIGLSAFHYRTKKQTVLQLERWKAQVEKQRALRINTSAALIAMDAAGMPQA